MTSASACRPRLVGRPRGIMPAPTASDVRAWGLLVADHLQGHEPNSTTAESAHLSLGLIDGRAAAAAAASPPSFRPANENARTITRRQRSRVLPASFSRQRRVPRGHVITARANLPRELHVATRSRLPRELHGTSQICRLFLFLVRPLMTLKFDSCSIVCQSYSRTVTGAFTQDIVLSDFVSIR